ncbi:MAG TPA: DUF1850 domain-containing protein, partial [Candidatus Acidoferrum sp.]|nr:DUF1850 domain-containing protein [Candidatus Acidoferrum sp.]
LGPWLGAIGVAIVAFLLYPQYPVLDVTTVRDSRLLLCARMAEGEEFILSFIHSVNKRPVYDTIRMEGDHLRIVKSRYDSFGAGMPEATANGMQLQIAKDGWLEWIVDRPVPEVTFFVGWVADHSLRLKGREIALKALVEPGTLLSLHTQKASWYHLWKGRCAQ